MFATGCPNAFEENIKLTRQIFIVMMRKEKNSIPLMNKRI